MMINMEKINNNDVHNTLSTQEELDLAILREAFEKVKPIDPRILWDIFAIYFPVASHEVAITSFNIQNNKDILFQIRFGNITSGLAIPVDNPDEFMRKLIAEYNYKLNSPPEPEH